MMISELDPPVMSSRFMLASNGAAASGDDRLTRHESGPFAEQKCCQFGDFFGLPDSSRRCGFHWLRQPIFRED